MPTKRGTKKQSSRKGSKKTAGSKKLGRVFPLDDNPPILVGGGGSMLVWVRKDLNFNRIANPGLVFPNATYANPVRYDCYQVGNTNQELRRAEVNRGQGGGAQPPHGLNRGHHTRFHEN